MNEGAEIVNASRVSTLLNALDQDVEIIIRAKPRSRAAVKISVMAA